MSGCIRSLCRIRSAEREVGARGTLLVLGNNILSDNIFRNTEMMCQKNTDSELLSCRVRSDYISLHRYHVYKPNR